MTGVVVQEQRAVVVVEESVVAVSLQPGIARLQDALDLTGTAGTGKGWVRAADGSMVWTDLATQAELDAQAATQAAHAALTDTAHGGIYAPMPRDLVAPFDPRFISSVSAFGANDARACRVIVRKTGTLRDLTIYVNTSSGNIDAGVYSTAGTRAALYRTGSIACPAANDYRIVGDPQIAVTAGDQLDFVLACSNTVATFGRVATAGTQAVQLPAAFWPATGGALPKLSWTIATSFPLPASFTEASIAAVGATWFLMARVA